MMFPGFSVTTGKNKKTYFKATKLLFPQEGNTPAVYLTDNQVDTPLRTSTDTSWIKKTDERSTGGHLYQSGKPKKGVLQPFLSRIFKVSGSWLNPPGYTIGSLRNDKHTTADDFWLIKDKFIHSPFKTGMLSF